MFAPTGPSQDCWRCHHSGSHLAGSRCSTGLRWQRACLLTIVPQFLAGSAGPGRQHRPNDSLEEASAAAAPGPQWPHPSRPLALRPQAGPARSIEAGAPAGAVLALPPDLQTMQLSAPWPTLATCQSAASCRTVAALAVQGCWSQSDPRPPGEAGLLRF